MKKKTNNCKQNNFEKFQKRKRKNFKNNLKFKK